MDADGGAGQGDPAGRARLARGVLGSLVDLDLRAAGVDGEDGGRGAREGADEQERSEDRTELLDGSLLHVVFSLCLALCGGVSRSRSGREEPHLTEAAEPWGGS